MTRWLCRSSFLEMVRKNTAMDGLLLQAVLYHIAGGTRAFSALCARTRFPGQAAQRSDAALRDGFADLVVRYGFTNTNVHDL